jgi:hypothetical protein
MMDSEVGCRLRRWQLLIWRKNGNYCERSKLAMKKGIERDDEENGRYELLFEKENGC